MYTAALIASADGSLRTEQVFPDPSGVAITQNGKALSRIPVKDRANFEWTSELGSLKVNGSTSDLDFAFPSGLRVLAHLTDRVPWDASHPDRRGPEGWLGAVPTQLLPTHYFVHTLGSRVDYQVDGHTGKGFGHQEANYGRRFPTTYLWAQGLSADGRYHFVLTGGRFTIAGVTSQQYIVAFRSPTLQWNFRSIDLDTIHSLSDGCNGTLWLSARSRDGSRRLEVAVSAPPHSFSERIYTPMEHGFSNDPGGTESHTARATIWAHAGGSGELSERAEFKQTALEFAGDYMCGGGVPAGVLRGRASPADAALAFAAGFARRPTGSGRPAGAAAMIEGTIQKRPAVRDPARQPAAGYSRVVRGALGHGSWLAVASLCCAAVAAAWTRRRRRRTLQEGIADFYDASSGIWIEIWGEHMHHGYYEDGSWRSLEEHKAAQVRMIEEVLAWADAPLPDAPDSPQTILDVGCGVGGSSRFLQRRYGARHVQGITLSPEQCKRAQQMSLETGQGSTCNFAVVDALHMPFPDDSFDLIWSLESGEHMPDKPRFMSEMLRVCKPGGRVILVTWVHRDLQDGETLTTKEQRLLRRINSAYHLPTWCSIADYARIAERHLGMTGIRTADWTENIKPFWMAVILTALQPRGWWALARGGLETLRGALVMPLMDRGYRSGTIKFGLLTGCKGPSGAAPASAAAGSLGATTATTALPAVHASGCASAPFLAGSSRRTRVPQGRARWVPRPMRSSGMQQLAAACEFPRTLWDFTRPHTLIGTLISIPSLHLFAAAPALRAASPAAQVALGGRLTTVTLMALAPALLVNVYITGLNQIFDVAIDKQNKPNLPLASGRLSVPAAWAVVTLSLAAAGCLARSYPPESGGAPLLVPLLVSALLGTAYSAPPVRLKRSPFLAAFCIVVVRGLVVNLGFYSYAVSAAGLANNGWDIRSVVSAAFFAAFGLVIALMKDVPDVLGDESANIRSLSVRLGPARVFHWAADLLAVILAGATIVFAVKCAATLAVWGAHPGAGVQAATRGAMAATAHASSRLVAARRRDVDPRDPKDVYSFYMLVWKLFYVSYLLLPFAT